MRLLACSCRLSRVLPLLLAVAARSAADAAAHPSAPALGARDLAKMDAQFAASLQQVTSEQQALAERLDASRRLVQELFANEQEETLEFVHETRAKMLAIRQTLRKEMRAALTEVQMLLTSTAANAMAMTKQHKQDTATKRVDPMPAINKTCGLQTCPDEQNTDQSIGTKPSEPLISWSGVQEAVARVLVALAHYYELFAIVLVHYVVVVGLWVLLPAATIVAVLVLAAIAIAKLQAYQRARRRPRVVYSGYLRSHRLPTEETEARKRNGTSRKFHRLVNEGP